MRSFYFVVFTSQRADVSVHGRNSDRTAFDGASSSQRSVIKDLMSPVAAAGHLQTVASHQATDEAAVQPQLVACKVPACMTLGVAKKAADKQPVNAVQTMLSLHMGDSVSPSIFTGSSLSQPSKQSNTRHPVNGISDADQSLATCSGVYCL